MPPSCRTARTVPQGPVLLRTVPQRPCRRRPATRVRAGCRGPVRPGPRRPPRSAGPRARRGPGPGLVHGVQGRAAGHRRGTGSGRSPLRPPGGRLQPFQPGRRGVQAGLVVVPVRVPRAVQDQQPDRGRRVVLEQVARQDQVPRRLGHLGPGHADHADVHPGARERGHPGERLGQGGLVDVVREAQVTAARVDVDGGTEGVQRHCRALRVPARAAGPPGAFPGGLVPGRCLPHGHVERIVLTWVLGVVTELGGEKQRPAAVRDGARARPAVAAPPRKYTWPSRS